MFLNKQEEVQQSEEEYEEENSSYEEVDENEDNQEPSSLSSSQQILQKLQRKSDEEKQRNSHFKVGQSEITEILYQVNQVRFSDGLEDEIIRFSDTQMQPDFSAMDQIPTRHLNSQSGEELTFRIIDKSNSNDRITKDQFLLKQMENGQTNTYIKINEEFLRRINQQENDSDVDYNKLTLVDLQNYSKQGSSPFRIEDPLLRNRHAMNFAGEDEGESEYFEQLLNIQREVEDFEEAKSDPTRNEQSQRYTDILNVASLNKQLESKENVTIQEKEESLENAKQVERSGSIFPAVMKMIEYVDYRSLLISPLTKGGMLQCTVIRDRTGFNHFNPKFELYISNSAKFLLAAKKQTRHNSSQYIISMHQKELTTKGGFYLGKIRSDQSLSKFSLFDNGSKKKKSLTPRRQLGAIVYKMSISSKKPRDITVIIPEVNTENNQPQIFISRNSRENILTSFDQGNTLGMKIFKNNQPQWDSKLQSYVLNFFGRIKKASIKNFQLIDHNSSSKEVFFQFGRVSDREFCLDFQYPFSPLQAFMLCLSTFELKLS